MSSMIPGHNSTSRPPPEKAKSKGRTIEVVTRGILKNFGWCQCRQGSSGTSQSKFFNHQIFDGDQEYYFL
ncbi:hypothetical protein K438DRAFT_1975500 [Mycena galopus ATCC 62051]|nr:hypothetical protein K438DRAFT_1975500 [Mycena galopus ATCC 62051]